MRSKERLLDDIAKLAGSAVGSLGQIGGQIKGDLRARVDDMALRMDLVPREEFERLESMLRESRLQQAELVKRIEALEILQGKAPATQAKKKAAPKKSTEKTAAPKTTKAVKTGSVKQVKKKVSHGDPV